ncbi:EamA family transporter [Paractinoplanes atraurantiacus]|uniref:Inner membrane transporter RhtA n=1 Tax=Paractinoplanes atraurantiacus TaxID=1036182 RepID=A0A285ILE5_9ACTN|nr:EamA family transporter [Actinoplanes atraurantiacus]SNY47791.1 inner membrane transporter RhtA [Actinoplanes atraurantiacus]
MRSAPGLLVVMSVASAQSGSAVARTLFGDLGPAGVLTWRMGFAALVFAVVVRPPVWTWTSAAWRAAVLLGVFAAGLTMLSYLALRIAPQGIVVTASFAGPLVLALVQTRRVSDLLWALTAAGGVALLGLRAGADVPAAGLLLALAAGVCGAGYIVFSARLGGAGSGVGGLAVSFAVAALLVLPFGFGGAVRAFGESRLLGGAVIVALLAGVIPYTLEMIALRRLPTRIFGVLMSLQPAGAAVAGLLILGQRLGPLPIVALTLVSLAGFALVRGGYDAPSAHSRRTDSSPQV